MPDLDERLARCFALVFPDVPPDQIADAGVDTVEAWDSLAGVTLMAVLTQEFGVDIDPAAMLDLDSYAAIREYLQEELA